MPFRSKAQRAYLYARHPEVAEEFESKTPKGAKLPERLKPSKKKPKIREEDDDLGSEYT